MPWKYATVCSSNMNRSMEAHNQMLKSGLCVRSFGTGTTVRLPGPSESRPNVYEFGTPYADILADLKGKDVHLYTSNGLIKMLERNVLVKLAPERWQSMDRTQAFDVVFTYEERVFSAVLEDLQARETESFRAWHVINIETRDNHDEAVTSAQITVKLCALLDECDELEVQLVPTVNDFVEHCPRAVRYSLVYT
mmetsp:Transcript_16217/g.33334  ORF Transcript_16217/g.33334 Transcript_16217/m.33334 type:complete len:194 (+) Transcript_16217:80-661(+)